MDISVVDLHNSCKICLVSDLSLESIFSSTFEELTYFKILNLLVGPISISPKGSQLICHECKSQLKNFYNFRNTFLENDKYSNTMIKGLNPDDCSDDSQFEPCSESQTPIRDEPDNVVEPVGRLTRASTKTPTKKSKIIEKAPETSNVCSYCNRSFKQIGALKKHLLLHDPKRGEFKCEICFKRFTSKALLIRHSVVHSILYEKSKMQAENGKFLENQCLVCKVFLDGKDLLPSHYRMHKDKKFPCNICEETFTVISEYIKHTKIHQENSIYQCFECKLQFTVHEKLVDHLLIHQTNRPFECHICTKSFVKKHKLEMHMESHENVKDILCPICGQFFRNKDILARHLTRHNGEKIIACKKCPKKFFFKYELVSHMLSHNGVKKHVCEICGVAFSTNSSMRKHSKLHIKSEPNFECTYCNKKFSANGILIKHVRIHTLEKPFKCQYCVKSFTQSGDMRKHTKIHLGKNIYKCELDNCDKAFEKHGQLKMHWTQDHFE